jgi:adenylate kinase family enzyme
VEIPFGHIEEKTLYKSAFGDYEALVLETADIEDLTTWSGDKVIFYTSSFDKLKLKLDEIEDKIKTENNKGSFMSSLLNIKTKIPTHKGLGDYQELLDKIDALESDLSNYIQKNRQKNTEIKQALLLELAEILKNNDEAEAFELIKDIKNRWIKTGSPDLALKQELETKFNEGVDSFFEKRNTFNEDKKALVKARAKEYKEVIAKITSFVTEKNFGNSFDQVRTLQKQWKEIGRIPENTYKGLNDSYWEISKVYFESQKNTE